MKSWGDTMFAFHEKTCVIELTRGDTGTLNFNFDVEIDGEKVKDYNAVFHLRKNSMLTYPLLAAVPLQSGELFVSHELTKDLKAGEYIYDIEITAGKNVMTYGPYAFVINPDVG